MKLETSLSPQLQQQLKLAPQVIQSIEILQLPMMALVEHIQQELANNPVLEEMAEPEEQKTSGDEDSVGENKEEVQDDEFGKIKEMAEEWGDYFSQTTTRRSNASDESDQKQEALENTAAKPMSLQDYLLGQLSVLELDDLLPDVCENIIYNINNNGYLAYSLEEILESLEKPASMEKVKEALQIVQAMEPLGVGARNLKECLLLQLDKRDSNYYMAKDLISNYLEEVETKKYKLIAKKTGCNIEIIRMIIIFIKTLNPKPGSIFSSERVPYIVPEVRVDHVDGKYEVTLVGNNSIPRIYISSFYKDVLNKKNSDLQTKRYIRKKMESAKWLIDAIEQRKSTLYKVAVKIVELQNDFFDKGVFHLRTLKMQDVADIVGIHVSTVSRAISLKYMQTPQGVLDMKFFFTGGFKNVDGTMESWEAMRQKMAKIITEEEKTKPLSDEEIAAKLKEMGIDIARRTVTKYRRYMKIPSSRVRKES